MNLPAPVTVQPPPFARASGEIRILAPLTLTSLEVTIVDNATQKSCTARIARFPKMLQLWKGDEYDAIGDYTQAQAEARVLEVLGTDIKAGLERLFGK